MSLKSTVLIVVAVICAAAFSWWFLMRRDAQNVNAERTMLDYHQMKPQALEQEIRAALPLGSSLVTVDEFLKKRDIEHSFDQSSRTVYATVRKLKGSTSLTSESLTLKFHFDDDSKLKSIDSKVLYTGP
jgi:hypothetical protein